MKRRGSPLEHDLQSAAEEGTFDAVDAARGRHHLVRRSAVPLRPVTEAIEAARSRAVADIFNLADMEESWFDFR